MPALTLPAMVELPWWYVVSLIEEAARLEKVDDEDESDTAPASDASSYTVDDLVPCSEGGYYPPGYSKLMRMLGHA